MLSRLLMVRLKAAENALRDGRLDEAVRLATAEGVADHRRAKRVLAATAKALVQRAQDHFGAGRYADALADLDRAGEAGVELNAICNLRDEIRAAMDEQHRHQRDRRARIEAARRRIAAGSLLGGERILEQASSNDAEAKRLQRDVQTEQQEIAESLQEARRLLETGQLPAAIERFRRARRRAPAGGQLAETEAKLCQAVVDCVRQDLLDGRIDRAIQHLACLGEVGRTMPIRTEAEQVVSAAREAAEALRAARFDEARRAMRRLQYLLPEAKWATVVERQLQQVNEAVTELQGGALGSVPPAFVAPTDQQSAEKQSNERATMPPRPTPGRDEAAGAGMAPLISCPDRMLMLVDGVGSFLLLLNDRVSIGRMAADNHADIPLVADLAERHADIARLDEDYLLFAQREVKVNDRTVQRRVLLDGDRLTLGRHVRLTFRMPSRKSPTAVLDLGDRSRIANDVRRVILFSKQAIIGPAAQSHVVVPNARHELVLFERGGSLWLQSHPVGESCRISNRQARPVRIGQTIEQSGVSFCVREWSGSGPAS